MVEPRLEQAAEAGAPPEEGNWNLDGLFQTRTGKPDLSRVAQLILERRVIAFRQRRAIDHEQF